MIGGVRQALNVSGHYGKTFNRASNLLMKSLPRFFLFALTAWNCDSHLADKHPKCAESENYSIKFTGSDTIFLQSRFPIPKRLYYGIIQTNERKKLDSFLQNINLTSYDTVYFQNNLQDGGNYKFYLRQNSIVNWVLIYGHNGPKPLYEFADWLTALKDQQHFYPTNAAVNFGDLTYIILPPIPPPPKNGPNTRLAASLSRLGRDVGSGA